MRSRTSALVSSAISLSALREVVAGVGAEGRPPLLRRWGQPALLAAGALVLIDGVLHLIEPGTGLLLGLGGLAGGWWLLRGPGKGTAGRPPRSQAEWIERCEGLLPQFERLAPEAAANGRRREELGQLVRGADRAHLQLAVVGSEAAERELASLLVERLRGPRPLSLQLAQPLPAQAEGWCWPEGPAAADGLLFRIRPPLRASELRWLEAVPAGQPVWLLVSPLRGEAAAAAVAELQGQWPAVERERILTWDGDPQGLGAALAPLTDWLAREGGSLASHTARRRLEQLHGRWQSELERLRQGQWQLLQQRTQWLVAAGVLVAPLPSVDLLVLAIANGLMLREMARLWDCDWSLDQLRAAASELGRAALAQGLVEWSSQALLGALRLHGATWLVGGALQALSAAYLTRVVSRAMADVLALSAGVSEPDLIRIRREAPLLVARAAERERLDWNAFLSQAGRWLERQLAASSTPAQPMTTPQATSS